MTGMISNVGNSHEGIALVIGVLSIIVSVFFFLQRFQIINFNFNITDEFYLYGFAVSTFISGFILLLMTMGFIGTK